jgi:hypothetical protein
MLDRLPPELLWCVCDHLDSRDFDAVHKVFSSAMLNTIFLSRMYRTERAYLRLCLPVFPKDMTRSARGRFGQALRVSFAALARYYAKYGADAQMDRNVISYLECGLVRQLESYRCGSERAILMNQFLSRTVVLQVLDAILHCPANAMRLLVVFNIAVLRALKAVEYPTQFVNVMGILSQRKDLCWVLTVNGQVSSTTLQCVLARVTEIVQKHGATNVSVSHVLSEFVRR